MGAKTPFAKEELIGLLADYDLGYYQDHQPFEQGGDQTNICVRTTTGKYAFRYYEKRSVNYVLFEIDLLQYLARHTYPCPVPLQNGRGGYLGMYHHKPFAFFTFLEGEHTNDEGNEKEAAKAIGTLHTRTRGYEPGHADARDTPASCLAYATASAQKIKDKTDAKARLDWLKGELRQIQLPDGLPKGACHGDCNPTNFLYMHGRVSAILDFDQASYTSLLSDVANLIYWWTWPAKGEMDFSQSRSLLEAYETVRPLDQLEKEHLYDMLKMLNCMGYAWFIHDDTDYPGSQRNVERLNAIGREAFYKALFE
jgi:homoserine kinase type II